MAKRRYAKVTSFGEVLQGYRTEAGLSQARLASRSGMSTSLLALLELNRRTPRRDKVEALARGLQLNPKEQARLFQAAGLTVPEGKARVSFVGDSRVTKALEDLMNDKRLNSKQKLEAERNLETYIRWLRDSLVKQRGKP